ncbi:MAG TPA: MFS transporter [Syntrophorhabdaceae bacterium]|nr:MFS transporter [Syntrophorhabdaceae bacterium]
MNPNGTPGQKNIWSALREPFFRTLWMANVASLVGSWMHETASAWLMTSMTVSPFMVALLQTSMTLPFFLMALPAGALADIIDRRKILLTAQAIMLLAAVILGLFTLTGTVTPVIILVLTFTLAIAAAVNAPTWQSIIPELISRDHLQSAVTLGSVAFNVARVVGPVLGGVLLALAGPASVFFANALSFTGVIFALFHWKYRQPEQSLPAERFIGAIRTGVGYVRNVSQVKTVLMRMAVFSFFGSSLWTFLPIIARVWLSLSPSGFGLLMCFFGTGGLLGAVLLPRAGLVLRLKPLANCATLLFAASIAILSFSKLSWLTAIALIVGGAAWLVLISTYNTAILSIVPSWVRGRVMSVFMLVFFGPFATGSALWGFLGSWLGITPTLILTSVFTGLGIIATSQMSLSERHGIDLTPSEHWPQFTGEVQPALHEGPILVVAEYSIDPAHLDEFLRAVSALRTIRMRDGAFRWNLFKEAGAGQRFIESFLVESWVDYMRQQERFTVSDGGVVDTVRSCQKNGEPVIVRHFVAQPLKRQK